MKIAYLGYLKPSENLTGPEKFVKRLYQHALVNHIELIYIDYFYGAKFSYLKKLLGARKEQIDDNLIVYRMGIIRMIAALFRFKPQIIHLTCYDRSYIASFLYKIFSKVKIIYTVHGLIFYEDKMFKNNLPAGYRIKNYLYEKIVWKFSDLLVFVSRCEKELSETISFYKKHDSIRIIPNGVDSIFFETNERSRTEKDLNVVFVGNVNREEKGFAYYELIVDKYGSSGINFYCISDGEGIENKNIRILPRKSGMEYKEILSKMDVYISPSMYESFQIVLVEAMACGVVPLCSDKVGASYLIKNDENGFVLPLDDMDKWNEILSSLNNDRKRLRTLSHRAQESVTELSWDKIFMQYMDIYNDIMADG